MMSKCHHDKPTFDFVNIMTGEAVSACSPECAESIASEERERAGDAFYDWLTKEEHLTNEP